MSAQLKEIQEKLGIITNYPYVQSGIATDRRELIEVKCRLARGILSTEVFFQEAKSPVTKTS